MSIAAVVSAREESVLERHKVEELVMHLMHQLGDVVASDTGGQFVEERRGQR